MLSGDAADNAVQRLPQIQTHPAAQHALAHIPCHMLGVLQALNASRSGQSKEPRSMTPDCGCLTQATQILKDDATLSNRSFNNM